MSLYRADVNSHNAARAMRRLSGEAIISTLAELELLNGLRLRVFRKELSAEEADASWKNFEADLEAGIYRLAPLNEAAFERARRLARQATARLGTRTADILHVASALELGAAYFYSFDQQQRKVARLTGLKVN